MYSSDFKLSHKIQCVYYTYNNNLVVNKFTVQESTHVHMHGQKQLCA